MRLAFIIDLWRGVITSDAMIRSFLQITKIWLTERCTVTNNTTVVLPSSAGNSTTNQIRGCGTFIRVPQQYRKSKLGSRYFYYQRYFHLRLESSCLVCSNKFNLLHSLKAHERIHADEKLFSCSKCDEQFTPVCHLKTRKRIHTDEKPFGCSKCSKKLTQASHLKIHERIHTNGKPFNCLKFERKFTTSCALKTHEQIHTNGKPFSC